jgi:hypothetical protein
MTRNEGTADRAIRAVLGAVLILLALTGVLASPLLFWGGLVVGVALIGTGLIGYCPAYSILGIRTCRA